MKIPRSIELKMFLSEIRDSDFELNSDSFITILDCGMKLALITNKQLAKRVWTKEREVRRWRGGINIPFDLRQINVIHTLEEMMEARVSLTEWLEKMNSSLLKWCKAAGLVLGICVFSMLLLCYMGACTTTGHPFLAFLPLVIGLLMVFRYFVVT